VSLLLRDRRRVRRLRRPPREPRRYAHGGVARAASDFNYDFQAGVTEEQQQSGVAEYNFQSTDEKASLEAGKKGPGAEFAASVGTDWPTFWRERPGLSTFTLEEGVVYHTYSTYARGLDGLWGMYQWLDRAPKGRNEPSVWWRRHDEYGKRRPNP
jgi:predicted dithiol-disulfide oxidoreductase (DUF899 family)